MTRIFLFCALGLMLSRAAHQVERRAWLDRIFPAVHEPQVRPLRTPVWWPDREI